MVAEYDTNAKLLALKNIEKVETVFKDGVGYDPALIRLVSGLVGLR